MNGWQGTKYKSQQKKEIYIVAFTKEVRTMTSKISKWRITDVGILEISWSDSRFNNDLELRHRDNEKNSGDPASAKNYAQTKHGKLTRHNDG